MTTAYTGGCRCGAVRYEFSAEPLFPGFCHCRACQKSSGAPVTAAFAIPKDALKMSGEVRYYEDKADSGNTVRTGFCTTCGSRVFGGSSGMPDLAVIYATSLDDPTAFRPGMRHYTWAWDDPMPAVMGVFVRLRKALVG